jgi:hypothetical protein
MGIPTEPKNCGSTDRKGALGVGSFDASGRPSTFNSNARIGSRSRGDLGQRYDVHARQRGHPISHGLVPPEVGRIQNLA